jgi:hypothetical protein
VGGGSGDVVLVNLAGRPLLTCVLPGQHSAWWRLHNCYSDYAVTNASQLMDLLRGADVSVAPPGA